MPDERSYFYESSTLKCVMKKLSTGANFSLGQGINELVYCGILILLLYKVEPRVPHTLALR